MGNNSSSVSKGKYVVVSQQIQVFEEGFEQRLKKLKETEEEIDRKIKLLEDKLKHKDSLKDKLEVHKSEFIDKIKKYGTLFPDCLKWTLDVTMFLEIDDKNWKYIGIYQYGNYRTIFTIPLIITKVNGIDMYKLDNYMSLSVYKREIKDAVYKVHFPFSILHERADLIDICLYYDENLYKDIVFAHKDLIIDGINLNFSRFVTVVEKWIKWAVQYQEQISMIDTANITEIHVDNQTKNPKDEMSLDDLITMSSNSNSKDVNLQEQQFKNNSSMTPLFDFFKRS